MTNGAQKANENNGYYATAGAIIGIIIICCLSIFVWPVPAIAIICIGAFGGLAHELVQSQGKYMLPAQDGENYCLGGLMGLIEGAIAGVLLIQGQTGTPALSQTLLISAFLAGLALKGVSDSVNNYPQKGTTPAKV